jgi:hypothetical protein
MVERPENRQPAVLIGRGQAGQVGGVDDQHRVELEADARPRLDVAHAREQEGGQQFAVTEAGLHAVCHFLQQPVARRVLEQAHGGLDVFAESHELRVEGGVRRGHRRQAREEREVAETRQYPTGGRAL